MRVQLRWAWRAVVLAASAVALGARAHSAHDLAHHDLRIPYTRLPADPSHLLDLELSNVVLATSVDGGLSGIDRATGTTLWNLPGNTSDLLHPLVASSYGARQQSLEDLAAEALAGGDPAALHALQGSGIYIVEPSSGGDLYVLRMRSEHGEMRPQLEKMPFSLPELVAMSPFSLSSDDTRIFVAEKHTRLVELNVFTGTIGTVFDAKDAHAYDRPGPHAFAHARQGERSAEFDAIESPWVYIGRTDYTLAVHVRNVPDALQTLHYSVYAPNSADKDMAELWAQHAGQLDKRGMLAAPEDHALVCFDLRDVKKPGRHAVPPMPPVLWKRTLNATLVDIFDVIFVPPTATLDTLLLQPVIVPHPPGILAQIVEQQRPDVAALAPSAYVGVSPDGSLYALGRTRYPLVELTTPAAVTKGTLRGADTKLQPWVGGYEVPNLPDPNRVPLLDPSFHEYVPLLGASPAEAHKGWLDAPGLLLMRVLGAALLLFVIVRGIIEIRKDRTPLILNTDTLRFDEEEKAKAKKEREERAKEKEREEKELAAKQAQDDAEAGDTTANEPVPPTSGAEAAGETSAKTDEPSPEAESDDEAQPMPSDDDPKRRRRRRGKRAGAAVLARQSPAPRRTDSSSQEPHPGPLTTPGGAEIPPSSLQISDDVLGYGSSGTVVFRGTFQGRAVAVKRLLRDFVQMASKEVSLLQSADNHPNVIRYFCQELTPNFLYIALEQCPASLADLVERPLEFSAHAPLLEPRNAFKQITAGLQHLHSLSIVHRDIKPQNILVTLTGQNKLRMLLSDFGLSKRMDGVAQSSFSQSVNQPGGTVGWRAPEVLQGHCAALAAESDESARLTRAVDIFSLGCVAFYMLTGGAHPFGTQYEREMHILQQRFDLSALEATCDDTIEAQALIQNMIARDAAQRPSAERVAQHPFFWNAQRRLSFLQDVSDRFETLEREPPAAALLLLEKGAVMVIGADWRKRFDRAFLDDVGRFRKYDAASVQDLLRVIRNKKHHFQDMQPQLKKQLSPMPEGFLQFFARRFPQLFLHVYQVMDQLPMLRSEPMFHSYYQHDEP